MARWLAGIAAVLLLATGSFLAFTGSAEEVPIPPAPQPRAAGPMPLSTIPAAPEADAMTKEQRRFDRADKDDNGRITAAEQFEPRRKAFAKLDANGNGSLSFDEWAARSIGKFQGADKDQSGWLTPGEFATTAPKPRKKPACSC